MTQHHRNRPWHENTSSTNCGLQQDGPNNWLVGRSRPYFLYTVRNELQININMITCSHWDWLLSTPCESVYMSSGRKFSMMMCTLEHSWVDSLLIKVNSFVLCTVSQMQTFSVRYIKFNDNFFLILIHGDHKGQKYGLLFQHKEEDCCFQPLASESSSVSAYLNVNSSRISQQVNLYEPLWITAQQDINGTPKFPLRKCPTFLRPIAMNTKW